MSLLGRALAERLPDLPRVQVTAVCHDCQKQHTYRVRYWELLQIRREWESKHPGHPIAYQRASVLYDAAQALLDRLAARQGWQAYGHNADGKIAYVATSTYTLTGTSLASSSTLLAGRESTVVSNVSNKYLDLLLAGKTKVSSSSVTANTLIQLWIYAVLSDDLSSTVVYPDTITGSDANCTLTSAGVRDSALKIAPEGQILVDATTANRAYYWAPFSMAARYGYVMPTRAGVWLVQSTGQNLSSTAGDHVFYYTPVYNTIS